VGHIGLAVVDVSPPVQCIGHVDSASVVITGAHGLYANAIDAVASRHCCQPWVYATVALTRVMLPNVRLWVLGVSRRVR
jgi:hypothetical protein